MESGENGGTESRMAPSALGDSPYQGARSARARAVRTTRVEAGAHGSRARRLDAGALGHRPDEDSRSGSAGELRAADLEPGTLVSLRPPIRCGRRGPRLGLRAVRAADLPSS